LLPLESIKVMLLACKLRTTNLPKFSATSDAGWLHGRQRWHHSVAGSQLPSTTESRNTRPRRMQEKTACRQIAERFEPNTVLWAFRSIQPFSLI